MKLATAAKILDFSSHDYEVPLDEDANQTFWHLNQRSDSFLHLPVRKKSLPKLKFVASLPKLEKVKEPRELVYRALVFERVAKIANTVLDHRFPEIVDFLEVELKDTNLQVPVIVTEYIRGKNLHYAIRSNYLALAKDGDIYDPSKRMILPVNLRRVKRVLTEILSVQESLYKHNLLHIGIVPDHVILQIDDIVRLRGLRFIVRIDGINITDKAITDVEKYGPVFFGSYTHVSLFQYIRSGGKGSMNVFKLLAYQVAKLLFDLTTKGEHIREPLTKELAESATYHVRESQVLEVQSAVCRLLSRTRKFKSLAEIREIVESIPG